MTTAKLTADQMDRIATMNEADAACWVAYYEWKAEEAEEARQGVETAIREMVAANGQVEPNAVRKLFGLAAVEFNSMIRYLKFTGGYAIDEAGLMVAAF